jgi:hypothetical protein
LGTGMSLKSCIVTGKMELCRKYSGNPIKSGFSAQLFKEFECLNFKTFDDKFWHYSFLPVPGICSYVSAKW